MPPSLAPHLARRRPGASPEPARRESLLHALDSEATIAFVGSGCSPPRRYPSWDQFVIDLGSKALSAEPEGEPGPWSNSLLSRLRARIKAAKEEIGKNPEAKDLFTTEEKYLFLGLARARLHRPASGAAGTLPSPYFDYFDKTFGRREPAKNADALEALLELPIRRFVTTNYDVEIEEALCRRAIPVSSFTQEPDFLDALTVFALSELEFDRASVFHCHGRYNRPDSIIATERDYQRWHLGGELAEASPGPDRESALKRQGEATAFRQAIELLMSSNPILFVGSRLSEDDLLRPVRLLAALEPQRRQTSQIFALLRQSSEDKDKDNLRHEFLFERYGIQVIPFNRSIGLARTLKDLKVELEEYRASSALKPKFRKVDSKAIKQDKYWHHRILPDTGPTGPVPALGDAGVEARLEEIRNHFRGKWPTRPRASVVVLSGPGGTGKSYHAGRFVDQALGYSRTFFWSSYYSDDFLAGVDRLLAFLGISLGRNDSRLSSLANYFRKRNQPQRSLVVLDGIERLLVPTRVPGIGAPTNAAVRELLRLLATQQNHTDVMLTTRLVPTLYRPQEEGGGR